MKKIMLLILAGSLVLIVMIGIQWPDGRLHVVFCDVGQGDAILIKKGHWQMLVDGGPDQTVTTCLNQHLPFWDKQLEQLVITHADKDHIGGLVKVLELYQVKNVWLSDQKPSQTYQKLLSAMDNEQLEGMTTQIPFLGAFIDLNSELKIYALWPQKYSSRGKNKVASGQFYHFTETILSDEILKKLKVSKDGNDRSIVLFIQFFHYNGLLMGDASKSVELALIEKNLIKDIDTLKIGHHGSKSSTSTLFLKLCQPEISILSCGENNSFGHPSQEVLDRLQLVGSKIMQTDKSGTIELVTDGLKYWLIEHHQ